MINKKAEKRNRFINRLEKCKEKIIELIDSFQYEPYTFDLQKLFEDEIDKYCRATNVPLYVPNVGVRYTELESYPELLVNYCTKYDNVYYLFDYLNEYINKWKHQNYEYNKVKNNYQYLKK